MPRKSIALFLATTGLLTSLTGCGPDREAGEKGGEAINTTPAGQSAQPTKEKGDNGEKEHKGDKEDEGGEGGEGGEG